MYMYVDNFSKFTQWLQLLHNILYKDISTLIREIHC